MWSQSLDQTAYMYVRSLNFPQHKAYLMISYLELSAFDLSSFQTHLSNVTFHPTRARRPTISWCAVTKLVHISNQGANFYLPGKLGAGEGKWSCGLAVKEYGIRGERGLLHTIRWSVRWSNITPERYDNVRLLLKEWRSVHTTIPYPGVPMADNLDFRLSRIQQRNSNYYQ